MLGALSDERTGLSFVIATGPRQRSKSRVRVPWDSRPYFTVSDSRLPFSSPPTTRRVTVEVFDPASTRVELTAESEYESYVTTDGQPAEQSRAEQSVSLLPAISRHGHSWHRAPVGPVAIYLLLV
jgi:hypothetical protein